MAPVALDLRLLSSGWRLNTLPKSMSRNECRDIQFDAWFSARWKEPGFAENYPNEDITDLVYWKNSIEGLQTSLKK